MKIPTSYAGIDGKTAYEKIVNAVEPKPKGIKEKVESSAPLQIQEHDKYEYFFAGENEFNLYKIFVETNFPKKQIKGIQTLEELAKPTLENKLFKGSSPKINSAMNMALRDEGIQVVTQAQLEYIFQNNLLLLTGIYSDTGMCLRTNGGENEEQAKELIKQLGNNFNLPIYLPVISYDLIKNKDNSLGFKIIDLTKILNLPILDSQNQSKFDNSDIDLSTGFPKQLNEKGVRTFWTRPDGLSGCFLGGGSNLDSGSSDLSDSDDGGRVVLAKVR